MNSETGPVLLAASPTDASPRSAGRTVLAALLLLAGVALAFYLLPLAQWLQVLREAILSLGWQGIFLYIGAYAVCALLLIPSTALGLLAGSVFGLGTGVLAAAAGSNLAAWTPFLLARTVLRRRVEEWARARPRFQAVDAAVDDGGLPVVLLVRLSPVFPYTILNYLMGLTRLPFWKYAVGSVLGMLPGNFVFVYMGTLPTVAAEQSPGILALQVAGLLATLAAMIVITRLARRKLELKAQ